MDCSMSGFPVLHCLPEFAQAHVLWVSDAIQPSHPLSSPSPCTFNLSQHQGLFQWAGSSHQVSKVLELQLQHRSFQWIFKTDFLSKINWLDLLAVQGTLKSLLQHHSSKAAILQCSAFFMVQLLHPYMTTRKTVALSMQTSVSNGMSLLFNTLSRLVRGNRLIERVWDGTQYRAFLANPSWCWRYCPEEAHLEDHWLVLPADGSFSVVDLPMWLCIVLFCCAELDFDCTFKAWDLSWNCLCGAPWSTAAWWGQPLPDPGPRMLGGK